MTQTATQEITRLPQSVRDFIRRSGRSLNSVAWKATYQYPEDANAFRPTQTDQHYFILRDGHQLSFLTRHQTGKQGTVYEIAPRQAHGAPRPAAPRKELRRVKPQIIDETPYRPTDENTEPSLFAAFQYWYSDGVTPCQAPYLITCGEQTFQGETSQTGKIPLRQKDTVHYAIGEKPSDTQWQDVTKALTEASEHLLAQIGSLAPPESLPAKVPALHLINTGIIIPGDAATLSEEMFQDGYPCQALFTTAAEVWENQHQRGDLFAKNLCQALPIDKEKTAQHLGECLGLSLPMLPTVAAQLFNLLYVLSEPDITQPLLDFAEQEGYANPDDWVKELLLTALLCSQAKPSAQRQPSNHLQYYDAFQALGSPLQQFADLLRQQHKVQTLTEQHSREIRLTVPVPELPENWAYLPAQNLSTPKKILRLGIFFDGTGQDRYKDEVNLEKEISNPARLHDLYRETENSTAYEVVTTRRIYVRGIGTLNDGKVDGLLEFGEKYLGLGLALGPEGGVKRIQYALGQMSNRLKDAKYDEVIFDLFGFSRGASLARHFTNLVNEWPAKYRSAEAFPQHLKGRVAFVGLFDTVGSFYMPGNDDEGIFNLNLSEHSAERVVHLTAQNEVRVNFPATLISDAHNRLPPNFTELGFPGVHTDIGGGYQDPLKGKYPTMYDDWRSTFYLVKHHSGAGMEPRRLMLILEQLNQRKALYVMEGTELFEVYTVYRGLEVYPLQTMHQLATEAGVPLKPFLKNDPRYQVPTALQTLYERWQQEDHGQFHKAPKRLKEFIHRSDNDNLGNQAGNRREWFPNQPDLAVKPRNRHEKTA